MLKARVSKTIREYLQDLVARDIPIGQIEILNACNSYIQQQKEALDVGTQVHNWVEMYTKGETLPMPENDSVKNGILAFLKRKTDNKVEFIESEKIVYHKAYNYIGKLDAIAKISDKVFILDYKTSKSFYAVEMSLQLM